MIDIHKEKCKQLMKIRKLMADKLGIDLHQRECTFEGKCSGTCPKCKQEEENLNRAILQRTVAAGVATTMGVSMVGCSINNKDDVSLNTTISTNTIEEQTQEQQIQEHTKNVEINNDEKEVIDTLSTNSNIETNNTNIANYIDVQSLFNSTNDNVFVTNTGTTLINKPTSELVNSNTPTPTNNPVSTKKPTISPTSIPVPTKEAILYPTNTPTSTPKPTVTPKPTTKPTITVTPTPIATVTPIVAPDPTGIIIDDDEITTPTPTPTELPSVDDLTGMVVVDPITPTPTPSDDDDDGPIAPGLTGNVVYIPTETPTPTPIFADKLTGLLIEN